MNTKISIAWQLEDLLIVNASNAKFNQEASFEMPSGLSFHDFVIYCTLRNIYLSKNSN